MILLFPPVNVAIMTPPKCATCALHQALCGPPWHGHTVIGPSAPGLFDRHVNTWPSEAWEMHRAVVVRNPYSRLVSLYLHHVHWQAALGFGGPDFGDFCRLIAEGSHEPFYGWNLCQWLGPGSGETVLRVESLEADLAAIGIGATVPRMNSGFYRKPWQGFYNSELLDMVKTWAAPDCERYGYAGET